MRRVLVSPDTRHRGLKRNYYLNASFLDGCGVRGVSSLTVYIGYSNILFGPKRIRVFVRIVIHRTVKHDVNSSIPRTRTRFFLLSRLPEKSSGYGFGARRRRGRSSVRATCSTRISRRNV